MSDYQEKVTTSQNSGIDEAGNQVQQKTKKIDTQTAVDGNSIATNIVWFIVGIIEVSLAFRLILKLFGANPSNSFVNFIYSITNVLTAPFDSIFSVSKVASGDVHSVFEPSIIVAAVVYALLGWGIVKLINIAHKTD